ncbi:hypothetical protein KUTeg_007314 [Tegillarca granosa]|uniref:Fibrinogen C-terminal domain-containing protein n=1 Tax=Tegillarca granosa TaxID=220873 RepID=A0ABQ9FCW5_TEGGR|nr:hypothetical protein KUTeg_007314 [Tegillarca granosa]
MALQSSIGIGTPMLQVSEIFQMNFGLQVVMLYFVGLQTIYEITSSASYELRFDLEDYDGNWKFAIYSNFKLGDASANYTLNYDVYTGNAEYRFATYDHDFNECSFPFSGAWWFNSCHNANLNGLYGDTRFGKGLNWKQWHGFYYSLKTTEIKIRRM